MRVLLTGHDGYIGAVMIPMLQEAGHEVVGMDSHCTASAHSARMGIQLILRFVIFVILTLSVSRSAMR